MQVWLPPREPCIFNGFAHNPALLPLEKPQLFAAIGTKLNP